MELDDCEDYTYQIDSKQESVVLKFKQVLDYTKLDHSTESILTSMTTGEYIKLSSYWLTRVA